MAPVVHGLSALPESDVQAIADYFADVDHAGERSASINPAVARAIAYASLGTGQDFDADARLYAAACASCHYNSGQARSGPAGSRPQQRGQSARYPTNLIHVMLRWHRAKRGHAWRRHAGLRAALSDTESLGLPRICGAPAPICRLGRDLTQKIAAVRAQVSGSRSE